MIETIFTMGVYGISEDEFFDNLIKINIEAFCDIRRRRAVRGSKYSFVNSKKLQKKLKEMGIQYFHFLDLSPSNELRKSQQDLDKKLKILKREREHLSEFFIRGYNDENLKSFDSNNFINNFNENNKNILLFCVEHNNEACHRSILAKKLGRDLNLRVHHI